MKPEVEIRRLNKKIEALERRKEALELSLEIKNSYIDGQRKDEYEEYTYTEIAKFIGISPRRILQIYNNAIYKLKHPKVSTKFKTYIERSPVFKNHSDIIIDFDLFIKYGSGISLCDFHNTNNDLLDETVGNYT